MRRSEQRRAAVIALYQHDLTGRPLSQTLPSESSLFARALAHAGRADAARDAARQALEVASQPRKYDAGTLDELHRLADSGFAKPPVAADPH